MISTNETKTEYQRLETSKDLDALLDRIGESRYVLLGEAIGVVYNPESERGNYVSTLLPSRYDAFLYFDHSSALHPLHLKVDDELMPETYQFGF